MISTSTSYTLNVWREAEDTPIAYEFANTDEATISIEINSSFTLSADAKVSGGITDGFLGVDAGGNVGTELTYQDESGVSGYAPYEAFYNSGTT